MENLDLSIFRGEERLGLKEVARRANQPRVEVFRRLLFLEREGKVNLEQANPERFGEIIVERGK
jgi:chromatin segregation and condensation protein Rec8/ScpA/Scc1 (kleisin family)